MADDPMEFEADTVAITSDDVGEYGLKVMGEAGVISLLKYSRSARGQDSTTEVTFDQRMALYVAKAIEGLGTGKEFTPMQDLPPEDRQPVCPNCCHNGAFDGQGYDSKGRAILRCAECDATMHLPE